jgi:hypothetical protein
VCYLAARLVGYDPYPCLLLKVCLLLSLAKSFIFPAYSFHIPALFHGARLLLVHIDAALHVNIRLQGGRDGMWRPESGHYICILALFVFANLT